MPMTGWLAYPGQPYADGSAGTLTVCAGYGGYARSVLGDQHELHRAEPGVHDRHHHGLGSGHMLIDLTRVRLGDAQGFTLIELCVAMAGGIVVMIGLLSIMIATLHQTQRTFTKVDATRQARTAIATIENELDSACVGGVTPIQAGSTPTISSS